MSEIRLVGSRALVARRAVVAGSMRSRLVGLLGRATLDVDEALILPGCNSVHTCGMRFPIDVVFVDRRWRIVAVVAQMVPWRLSPMVWKARAVIELSAGTVARAHLAVGDRLEVISDDFRP